jgi:hypothetical protein
LVFLKEDLGGGREGAAGADQLDGPVQVSFRMGQLLGQCEGIPGFVCTCSMVWAMI